METILLCAAVRIGETSIHYGERHYKVLGEVLRQSHRNVSNVELGFITSLGRFVTRREALVVAAEAGQVNLASKKGRLDHLYSEDLY